MQLRYPYARLEVFNLLSANADCSQALAGTACKLGLTCPQAFEDIGAQAKAEECGSIPVARQILEMNAPENSGHLFKQLLDGVEEYKQERNQTHCRGVSLDSSKNDCSSMAPVVMDLLLQLLDSYKSID